MAEMHMIFPAVYHLKTDVILYTPRVFSGCSLWMDILVSQYLYTDDEKTISL